MLSTQRDHPVDEDPGGDDRLGVEGALLDNLVHLDDG
jgi:hypothetical protein